MIKQMPYFLVSLLLSMKEESVIALGFKWTTRKNGSLHYLSSLCYFQFLWCYLYKLKVEPICSTWIEIREEKKPILDFYFLKIFYVSYQWILMQSSANLPPYLTRKSFSSLVGLISIIIHTNIKKSYQKAPKLEREVYTSLEQITRLKCKIPKKEKLKL